MLFIFHRPCIFGHRLCILTDFPKRQTRILHLRILIRGKATVTTSSDFAVSLCGPAERVELCVGSLWILDFAITPSFCNDCSGFCSSARKQQKIRNPEFRIQSLSPTGFRLPKTKLKTHSASWTSSLGLGSGFWILDFATWICSMASEPAGTSSAVYNTLSRGAGQRSPTSSCAL